MSRHASLPIRGQADALAEAADLTGRRLRELGHPAECLPLAKRFVASSSPLDQVAGQLQTWLRRDCRDLNALQVKGDSARMNDSARDRARRWEIASRILSGLGEVLDRAEQLSPIIDGFPSPERVRLDAESQVDQLAVLENELSQVRVRVRLALLQLAACASGDGGSRWDAEIGRATREQARLELERIELVRVSGEQHTWQDREEQGRRLIERGSRQQGEALLAQAAEDRQRHDAVHKFGPLAPLRDLLSRVEREEARLEVFGDAQRSERWQRLLSLLAGRTLFVLGSSHQDDDVAVAQALFAARNRLPNLLLVVAPRNILEARDVLADISAKGFRCGLLGELTEHAQPEVIVLDVLGFLMPLYQRARGAFIGGGLHGVRDHNFCEPLVFGTPTWTGPHHFWSPERWGLLQRHAPELVRVLEPNQLDRLPEELLSADASDAARRRRQARLEPFLEEAERLALVGIRGLPASTVQLLRELREAPDRIESCPQRDELVYLNLVKLVALPNVLSIEGDWQPYWRLTHHVGYLLDRLDG